MFRLLIITLLVGCTAQTAPPKPNAPKVERITEPKTIMVNGNQIVVVDVPSTGGEWFDAQRCYIYRDVEFKTSSITCPTALVAPAIESDWPRFSLDSFSYHFLLYCSAKTSRFF